MKSVIVTREEADVALGAGKVEKSLPFRHLAKKFKEEHGLEFTPEELEDGTRFKFQEDIRGRAFKVTYLGGSNETA